MKKIIRFKIRKVIYFALFCVTVFSASFTAGFYAKKNHVFEGKTERATNVQFEASLLPTAFSKDGGTTDEQNQKLFQQVYSTIKSDYVEEINNDKLMEYAINGMLSSLDPHSGYMNKDEYQEMKVQTSGQFGGLGIEITSENSMIKVISPIDGTPAFEAGIQSGDYITHVDDESIIGATPKEAADKMRGKVGTKVKITIVRQGEKEPLEFKLKRDVIKIQATNGEAIDNVMYIKLRTFSNETYSGLEEEISKLKKQIGEENVAGLVLDLRNNPGGLLNQAIMVSDAFLDKGKDIVSIKGRDSLNQSFKASFNELLIPDVPVVVLINQGSASASEIVAGALQDNKRAVVMGVKSFGKGSVQSVIDLSNGGAIRMTIARYYTPSGNSIQATGIVPDIEVEQAKVDTIEIDDKWISSEAKLEGHLSNDSHKDDKKALKAVDTERYKKDYQLARAVDLIRGISFYKASK